MMSQVRIWFQNRRMKWRQEQRIIFRHSGKPSGTIRPENNLNLRTEITSSMQNGSQVLF